MKKSEAKTKILIIDDDAGILDALSLTLEDLGYKVKTATKDREAFSIINNFFPDLILLDILMSGKDGREICKKIKKDDATKKIPVILVSAHPSAAKSYKSCKAEDFLAKPFEIQDLTSIIKKYI